MGKLKNIKILVISLMLFSKIFSIIFFLALKITLYKLLRAILATKTQLFLILFMMIGYGLIGTYLFKGKLENRCRVTPFPDTINWKIDEKQLNLCGEITCKQGTFCGNPWDFHLTKNETEYNNNINLLYGVFNFDDLSMSLFSGVLMLAQTGWSSLNDIVVFYLFFILNKR